MKCMSCRYYDYTVDACNSEGYCDLEVEEREAAAFEKGKKEGLREKNLSDTIEDLKADICDNYCIYHANLSDQETLDIMCKRCPLNRL